MSKEGCTLKKTLTTISLMLLLAVLSLGAVLGLMMPSTSHVDADPNMLMARAVLPYLRDYRAFRLADVYPDKWDTVQIVGVDEALLLSTWQALRSFDAGLAELAEGAQLLVFWRDGEIVRMVRFDQYAGGMPWFMVERDSELGAILSRDAAVFTPQLITQGGAVYYACIPAEATADI